MKMSMVFNFRRLFETHIQTFSICYRRRRRCRCRGHVKKESRAKEEAKKVTRKLSFEVKKNERERKQRIICIFLYFLLGEE